jgi:sorting nexin-29
MWVMSRPLLDSSARPPRTAPRRATMADFEKAKLVPSLTSPVPQSKVQLTMFYYNLLHVFWCARSQHCSHAPQLVTRSDTFLRSHGDCSLKAANRVTDLALQFSIDVLVDPPTMRQEHYRSSWSQEDWQTATSLATRALAITYTRKSSSAASMRCRKSRRRPMPVWDGPRIAVTLPSYLCKQVGVYVSCLFRHPSAGLCYRMWRRFLKHLNLRSPRALRSKRWGSLVLEAARHHVQDRDSLLHSLWVDLLLNEAELLARGLGKKATLERVSTGLLNMRGYLMCPPTSKDQAKPVTLKRLVIASHNVGLFNGTPDVIRTKAKHIEELAQSMGTHVLAIQETAQLEGRTLPLSVFMKQATRPRPATDQKGPVPYGGVAVTASVAVPFKQLHCNGSSGPCEVVWGQILAPDVRICIASTYWRQPRSYDGRPPAFPVEALIASCRSYMVKTPYVMIAGDFNVHVLTNELGNDHSASHNAPLRAALRQLLDSTGMVILNTTEGHAKPTHCFPNNKPRCIDLVLVSPALLPLCSLSIVPVFPHGHSMVVTTVNMSKLALQTVVQPPGRIQFSRIRHDRHLLADWQTRVSLALPATPSLDRDWLSAILVAAARDTLDAPKGPAPISASIMSLRNCHAQLRHALHKLGSARSKLFHSNNPANAASTEKALAPAKAQWREYRKLFKAELRRHHRERFADAIRSVDPRLDPSATTKIWRLINSYCNKQTASTSSAVISDEQLASTAKFWSYIWDRDPLSTSCRNDVSTELETYLSGATALADPVPGTKCLGVTKSNSRCRRAPTKGKSFCHQHNAPEPQPTTLWSAVTLNGAPWPVTLEELDLCLALMRNNRAPSLSHATVDMLKEAPIDAREQMCNMISHCIVSASYPAEWRTGHLRLLFKGKGDPADPANYRPINLTEALYRLTEVVIWQRVKERLLSSLQEKQGGFRTGRGTTEQLFILDTAHHQALADNVSIFVGALDVQKAFDSADHDSIVLKMARKGADPATCRLIRALLSGHISVIVEGQPPVDIKSGVIQGGILSPGEFNVFIDDMIPAELDVLHGIKLGNVSVASVLFADDTNLLSYTAKGLQSLLDTAYEWSSKWGIKFHPQKSNVLVLGVLPASLPTFKLGNAVLEYADSVRLLGIEFSSSSAPKRNELAATNEMIRRLPFMINGPAPMPTRMATLIWQCKIAPKLLYGCEVFPLDPRAKAIQHRVARTVLRAPKTVNSASVLEFLGWPRLESLSDQRLLKFAHRARLSRYRLISYTFETAIACNSPWAKRLAMLKDQLQLHAAWNMRYNKWCQAVDNAINIREQNHWSSTLNIPLDLINIPGRGSHLLHTGTGSNAKYAFLFRYDHTAHLKRHITLAHLAIDCPLCGLTDHSPKHFVFDCQATLCSTSHQSTIKRAQRTIRAILGWTPASEDSRLLAITSSHANFTTGEGEQITQSLATIRNIWNTYYQMIVHTRPAAIIERLYHHTAVEERQNTLVAVSAASSIEEINEICSKITKSKRTIRRWNQQAKIAKVIPPGFSVAKHKDLIKRINFALEYAALNTSSERKHWVAIHGDRSNIYRYQKTAIAHGALTADKKIVPNWSPQLIFNIDNSSTL